MFHVVSFPLASNYTPGLLLRFLDTTATNAVSLSFCKTLLLILNPSHRAQDELWGYPREPGTVQAGSDQHFIPLGKCSDFCLPALGALASTRRQSHVPPAAPRAGLGGLSPRPTQGITARVCSACPGAKGTPGPSWQPSRGRRTGASRQERSAAAPRAVRAEAVTHGRDTTPASRTGQPLLTALRTDSSAI